MKKLFLVFSLTVLLFPRSEAASSTCVQSDPQLSFRPGTNCDWTLPSPWGPRSVSWNQDGLQSYDSPACTTAEKCLRVVYLGMVPNALTADAAGAFGSLVREVAAERKLALRVSVVGFPYYGSTRTILYLREKIEKLHPDLIFYVWTEADLLNSYTEAVARERKGAEVLKSPEQWEGEKLGFWEWVRNSWNLFLQDPAAADMNRKLIETALSPIADFNRGSAVKIELATSFVNGFMFALPGSDSRTYRSNLFRYLTPRIQMAAVPILKDSFAFLSTPFFHFDARPHAQAPLDPLTVPPRAIAPETMREAAELSVDFIRDSLRLKSGSRE